MSTVKSRKKLLPPQNFLRRFCTALLLSTLHLSTPTNGDEILGKNQKWNYMPARVRKPWVNPLRRKSPFFVVTTFTKSAKTTLCSVQLSHCCVFSLPILRWSRRQETGQGTKTQLLLLLPKPYLNFLLHLVKKDWKELALICPFI